MISSFEKMMYDQGQLMSVFSIAYALKQEPLFKDAVWGIYDYVTKHLTSPSGAFYSAEDADSLPTKDAAEKKEGAFAIWSMAELMEILPTPLQKSFFGLYGVREDGNIDPSKDPHGEMIGMNVLDILNGKKMMENETSHLEVEEAINEAKRLVAEQRATRPRPDRDDKIITAWNGLMISGLCHAYRSFGLCSRFLQTAEQAMQFIIKHMTSDGKNLVRIYKPEGKKAIGAYPDDYTFAIQALLDLYECTLKNGYLDTAINLQHELDTKYWDPQGAAYRCTEPGSNLPMKLYDDYDGAEPSANSVAGSNLLRLSYLSQDEAYGTKYELILRSFSKRLLDLPFSMTTLLESYQLHKDGPVLAVIEAPSLETAEELRLTALSSYHPNMILKANFDPSLKQARAHVCKEKVCSHSVTSESDLTALLR